MDITVSQEAREAEVTVTQADRDAVDAFHRDSFRALFETTDEGSEDQLNRAHTLLCQAFARHRQSAERGEVAWLIERDDLRTVESGDRVCLHYYAEHRPGRHHWTPDHLKAKRFPTRESALAECNDDPLLRVCEHMWIGPQPSDPWAGQAELLDECQKAASELDRQALANIRTLTDAQPSGDVVEAVARAIMVTNGACFVKDWTTERRDNPHVALAWDQATAAITAYEAVSGVANMREALREIGELTERRQLPLTNQINDIVLNALRAQEAGDV